MCDAIEGSVGLFKGEPRGTSSSSLGQKPDKFIEVLAAVKNLPYVKFDE